MMAPKNAAKTRTDLENSTALASVAGEPDNGASAPADDNVGLSDDGAATETEASQVSGVEVNSPVKPLDGSNMVGGDDDGSLWISHGDIIDAVVAAPVPGTNSTDTPESDQTGGAGDMASPADLPARLEKLIYSVTDPELRELLMRTRFYIPPVEPMSASAIMERLEPVAPSLRNLRLGSRPKDVPAFLDRDTGKPRTMADDEPLVTVVMVKSLKIDGVRLQHGGSYVVPYSVGEELDRLNAIEA